MAKSPPRSFDEQFLELFGLASRPARRLLGDTAEPEDVAAEVLARALVRWRTLQGSDRLAGWVVTTSTNLSLDRLRKLHRNTPAPTEPTLVSSDDRIDMASALRGLGKRQREAVVLRYFLDLPDAEIAQRLGISVSSVKTYVVRGLGHLRPLFEPVEESTRPVVQLRLHPHRP